MVIYFLNLRLLRQIRSKSSCAIAMLKQYALKQRMYMMI